MDQIYPIFEFNVSEILRCLMSQSMDQNSRDIYVILPSKGDNERCGGGDGIISRLCPLWANVVGHNWKAVSCQLRFYKSRRCLAVI